MEDDKVNIKVHHQVWQGIGRKYLRTFFLLIIALLLLYFLQGIGTFLIFLAFIIAFVFYLVLRGNWLFEVNEIGILSGSINRRESIRWKDLQVILIELDQEQIYLRSGNNSRLINFQMIHKGEVEEVIKLLNHYAELHGINIQEKRGMRK